MINNYKEIEEKWRKKWEDDQLYKVAIDEDKPKYYVLDMFPYPSGAGLHVGHPLGYIASDIYSRFKRMKGFNVLHPMGFDAFGLPAEEYALRTGIHPAISTNENMARYRSQLERLGFSYDWSRQVATCDPDYYKWTQWIFTQLFEHYYDMEVQKAMSIDRLKDRFDREGNTRVRAATSFKQVITASDWKAMSRKQQADVLMQYRLAYRDVGYVNWCEELGTVLANDQVKDGLSERGGYPVVQKAMTQWYLRITAYADRLLFDLDDIDWSNSLKTIQSNWIGRSEGASIFFELTGSAEKIEVFTTRPDTIFGATYMVLAPEHDLVNILTSDGQRDAVDKYLRYVRSKSEVERMAEKEVTGVFIGAYAINPFTNLEIPIWIGEYVLKDYGTGAIMAVPSDDERDHTFATKFNLPIIDVVDKSKYPGATLHDKVGVIINSGFMNGMEVPEAIQAACQKVETLGIGKKVANYKMRDANFSRQRYWGEPFPVEYDSEGIASAIPIDQLPLTLPETQDFKPGKGGKSPLARLDAWVHPEPGRSRETDVMPAVAGSSWYFLRYMDPHNDKAFASERALNYWQSVDLYIGGSEHAVAHLMYARFWHKFLFDKGMVPTNEPFKKLINQGMIQGVIEFIYLEKEKKKGKQVFVSAEIAHANDDVEYVKIPVHIDFVSSYGTPDSYLDVTGIESFLKWIPEYQNALFVSAQGTYQGGEIELHDDRAPFRIVTQSEVGKMSKSKFNVINPEEVTERYGTDCFRMYEMFLGPIEQAKPWDTNGIDGVAKFIRRFSELFYVNERFQVSADEATPEELKALHAAIKKVGADIEQFSFNTAISSMMVCVNELKRLRCNKRSVLEPLVRILAPFAPFIAEELWHLLGCKKSVHQASFPSYDEKFLHEDTVSYPICINGKKRGLEELEKGMPKADLEAMVLNLDYVKKWTEGKQIRKVIVVPGRMINVVV